MVPTKWELQLDLDSLSSLQELVKMEGKLSKHCVSI